MITNKVVRVKADSVVTSIGLTLKQGTEIEIVMDVVYMSGFPVQGTYNRHILDWVNDNPTLVTDITRTR